MRTEQGLFRASVPSGASTGVHEAVELRDGGARFAGKGVTYAGRSPGARVLTRGVPGVRNAVANVNSVLGPAVRGMDPSQQAEVDRKLLELDGTPNKGHLGANAILGVSAAVAKAGAAAKRAPLYRHIAELAGNAEVVLPLPAFNIINGGKHAGNALPFQVRAVPAESAAARSPSRVVCSGIHAAACWSRQFSRSHANWLRGVPRAKGGHHEQVRAERSECRRRGRVCSQHSQQPGGVGLGDGGRAARGLHFRGGLQRPNAAVCVTDQLGSR